MPTYPSGHGSKHWLLSRFKEIQLVQLEVTTEQVAQSPIQLYATPDTLTYPSGTVLMHVELSNT